MVNEREREAERSVRSAERQESSSAWRGEVWTSGPWASPALLGLCPPPGPELARRGSVRVVLA